MGVDEKFTDRADDRMAAKAAKDVLLATLDEAGDTRLTMHMVNANLCGELVLSALRRIGLLNVEIQGHAFASALDEIRNEVMGQE